MLNRTERTIIAWRGDSTGDARLAATAQHEDHAVNIEAQTPETSVAFTISRSSLRELADFLSAVADEVDTWEDDTEQPGEPAPEDEGTVE